MAYELVPGVTPFLETLYNRRVYQDPASTGRDSTGYRVNLGTSLDLGGVVTGSVYAGYMKQTYTGSQYESIGGVGFGGSLLWNPTGLTSVKLNASRTIEETTTSASGYVASNVSLRLEQEVMRSAIVYGSVGYARNDYQGTGNKDYTPKATVGGEYDINRYFALVPEYSYSKKNSNQVDSSYPTHIVFLKLTGKI